MSSITALIAQGSTIRETLAESGLGAGQLASGLGGVALTLLCGIPLAAVVGTAFFALGVALMQWIAKMFGGTGTNDQLAFTMAAISVPYSLISAVFVLFSAIPYVGFCIQTVLALGGLYVVVLEIMAIKGVNRFGWGPAIGSFLIPGLALFLVCCAAIAIVLTISGAALGSVFSSLNSGLTSLGWFGPSLRCVCAATLSKKIPGISGVFFEYGEAITAVCTPCC